MKRRTAHVEPFNGCLDMIAIREPFDPKTPHGPSHVVLTARVARDTVFTCTIKIPLLAERSSLGSVSPIAQTSPVPKG